MTTDPGGASLTILTVLLAVLAAACSDVDEGSNDGGTSGSDGGTTTADCGSDTVNIAVNPWTGSAVNANVAKVIMETGAGVHGRARSTSTSSRSSRPCPPATSTPRSRCGRPVTRRTTRSTSTVAKGVIDGGELGVIGKIGWYIPTYMLDEHPELATWEGLNDNADLFATAETSPKGQMLDGDPSFVSYDAEIVENLGLNYEVVVAGTETAELASSRRPTPPRSRCCSTSTRRTGRTRSTT